MVVGAQVTYRPHADATPEAEFSAITDAYAFLLDSAINRGRLPDKSGPDDAKESHGCIATEKHTR
jgi:hypothetical protein